MEASEIFRTVDRDKMTVEELVAEADAMMAAEGYDKINPFDSRAERFDRLIWHLNLRRDENFQFLRFLDYLVYVKDGDSVQVDGAIGKIGFYLPRWILILLRFEQELRSYDSSRFENSYNDLLRALTHGLEGDLEAVNCYIGGMELCHEDRPAERNPCDEVNLYTSALCTLEEIRMANGFDPLL